MIVQLSFLARSRTFVAPAIMLDQQLAVSDVLRHRPIGVIMRECGSEEEVIVFSRKLLTVIEGTLRCRLYDVHILSLQ